MQVLQGMKHFNTGSSSSDMISSLRDRTSSSVNVISSAALVDEFDTIDQDLSLKGPGYKGEVTTNINTSIVESEGNEEEINID
jgi:hypothetical protein